MGPFYRSSGRLSVEQALASGAQGRYRRIWNRRCRHFTYQLEGTVGLRITHWLAAFAGYRALYYDLVEGEGALRNGTELTQHGPVIGAGVSF